MLRHDFISFAKEMEREQDAAADLWTWLPSYNIALQEKDTPSVFAILEEAAMLLSQVRGYPHSEREWSEVIEMSIGYCPTAEEVNKVLEKCVGKPKI